MKLFSKKNKNKKPTLLGARAFGFWAGQGMAFHDPAGFVNDLTESTRQQLARVGCLLYAPPGANIKQFSDTHLETEVDDIFLGLSRELGLQPSAFWPDNAPYALCLSHDIDRVRRTYQAGAKKILRGRIPAGVKAIKSDVKDQANPFDNFERISRFEQDLGIRSALYVLFERRRLIRSLLHLEPQHLLGVYNPATIGHHLKNIAEQGFEIGLHGSFNSWRNRIALEREIQDLARIMGQEIDGLGIRNHYLQFNKISSTIQRQAGILYDSTLGFNFINGFRCSTAFPFPLSFKHETPVELPLMIMDTALGVGTVREDFSIADRIFEKAKQNHGMVMINWHQRYCNVDLAPGMCRWVEKSVKQARKDGAYICLPKEAAGFWLQRVGEDVRS